MEGVGGGTRRKGRGGRPSRVWSRSGGERHVPRQPPKGDLRCGHLTTRVEHVHDPISLLVACYQALKPGGRLVLLTPNVDSLGHKLLGEDWRGLEPPRHLYLFSKQTLSMSVRRALFSIQALRTISQGAPAIWAESRIHRKPRDASPLSRNTVILVQKLLFYLLEASLSLAKGDIGEELLLIANKEA